MVEKEKPKGLILSVPVTIVIQSDLSLCVREEGRGVCVTSSDNADLTGGSCI